MDSDYESEPPSDYDSESPFGYDDYHFRPYYPAGVKTISTKSDADDLKARLYEVLIEEQGGSGSFAFGNTLTVAPNPGLLLHDHGSIGLPLSAHDAQAIISKSRQSPFGHKEQTLVNEEVRKSWELNPSQFTIGNSAWSVQIGIILDSLYNKLHLVCGREHVTAEINKLLLYEEGAFFKPHKDSEKAPGMFGTMVVCLPSKHDGGELLLKHDGEAVKFDFADQSEFGFSFAAWYADITHEVLPVTSGYRLVFTYNLIRKASATTTIQLPRRSKDRASQISDMLTEYSSQFSNHQDKWPPFIVHKLDHQYTQANLRSDLLKSEDYELVQCLMVAAQIGSFDLYLGTLEKQLDGDDGFDLSEFDVSYSLKHVVNPAGVKICDTTKLLKECLLANHDDTEGDPDESEREGWTGNEGSPATFWYRDTVVVIVPQSAKTDFLFGMDEDRSKAAALIDELLEEAPRDSSRLSDLVRLCELVIADCPNRLQYQLFGPSWYAGASSKRDRQSQLFQKAMIATLDLDKHSLFDKATFRCSKNVLLKCAPNMASAICRNGMEIMGKRLESACTASHDSSGQVFLDTVEKELRGSIKDPEDATLKEYKGWQLKRYLRDLRFSVLTKETIPVLINVCQNLEPEEIELELLPITARSSQATRIVFINSLLSKHSKARTPVPDKILSKQLQVIWEEFEFTKVECLDGPNMLNSEEVIQLITNSSQYDAQFTGDTAYQSLNNAMKGTDLERQHYDKIILPLVKAIVCGSLPSLLELESDPSEGCKTFVQNALIGYISKYVGAEPERPVNWVQRVQGCGCGDCQIVSSFLGSDKESALGLGLAKPRRQHLDQNFNDHAGLFTVENIARGSPHMWLITKIVRGNPEESRHWKTRFNATSKMLKDLSKSGPLNKILGSAYSPIMSARVEKLPTTRPVLQTIDANAVTGTQTQSNRKRPLEDEGTENATGKRSKPNQSNTSSSAGPSRRINIVDLTD